MKKKQTIPGEVPPEPQQAPVPKGKRMALIHYLTILFAAAFVLVLGSFLIEAGRSKDRITALSDANVSALSRAAQLQVENRSLQEKLGSTRKEKEELERELENSRKACEAAALVISGTAVKDGGAYVKAAGTAEALWESLPPEVQRLYTAKVSRSEKNPENQRSKAE